MNQSQAATTLTNTEAEAAAQDLMLRAMIEAACLLEGEPSDLEAELA